MANSINKNSASNEDLKRAAAFEAEIRRKRKRLILILLLLLLAALAYSFSSYLRNREIPIPTVSEANQEQVVPPNFIFLFDGGASHRLQKPVGVAIHPGTGNVYVSDTYNSRVSVFDPQGNYLFSFNKIGEFGNLYRPLYFAFDKTGNVYVTDRKRPGIYIFSEGGKFLRKFIPNGDPNFSWLPIALKIRDNGDLIVSDVKEVHRILVFNSQGSLKFSFGKTGQVDKMLEDPGLLAYPNSIDLDPDGNIVIADSNNRRLQIYSPQGKFIKLVDVGGIPRGIKFGYKNRLHIVDVVGHNVNIYDSKYNNIATFSEQGQNLAQMWFPTGIDVKGRRIYIADTENNRVEVWSWGVEVAVPRQIARGLDWLKILGPIALLLFLLWLRRRKYVADELFIRAAIDHREIKWIKDKLKKLRVLQEDYDTFFEMVIEDIKLESILKVWNAKNDLVERLMQEFDLEKKEAQIIALAKGRLFKPWLLSENDRIIIVARSLNLKAFSLDDIKGQTREKNDKNS